MNANSMIDYLSCILFKVFGAIFRRMPLGFGLFLGRRLGDLFYYLDFKRKAIVYSNLKKAFAFDSRSLSLLTKKFYRSFGQNIMEVFFIPLVDRAYLEKYIKIEGFEHVKEAFAKGKGVILLGVHEGSWELSNIICANLGLPFLLFVRDQKFPRLGALLNSYRVRKGCRVIQRRQGARQLIEALRANQAIGMTVDQGGKSGVRVDFFGRKASMPTGAIKLALSCGAVILPVFFTRESGPHIKVMVSPPFEIRKTGEEARNVEENLTRLVAIFEEWIRKYPCEYLWSYKIWKYGNEKDILIIHDGKAGHLRQAQAAARLAVDCLKAKGVSARIQEAQLLSRGRFGGLFLNLSCLLAGRRSCQGCMWCLKKFLRGENASALLSGSPDLIISCGSSLAAANFILARESLAKSVVLMRPSFLNIGRFDLAIISRHDNPLRRKNTVIIEGALNLIDAGSLSLASSKLASLTGLEANALYFGLLVGGDAKGFALKREKILSVLSELKAAAEERGAKILASSSRRTSKEVEQALKEELGKFKRCGFLLIANEKNIPDAVGGIFGLSSAVVVSPESISMISEAVSSGRQVFVFESEGLSKKHRKFLEYFAREKYIYLFKDGGLKDAMSKALLEEGVRPLLKDNELVKEALARIL
jgi:Kdo2-lipid IVA lauroyltransferase/acyltransferase